MKASTGTRAIAMNTQHNCCATVDATPARTPLVHGALPVNFGWTTGGERGSREQWEGRRQRLNIHWLQQQRIPAAQLVISCQASVRSLLQYTIVAASARVRAVAVQRCNPLPTPLPPPPWLAPPCGRQRRHWGMGAALRQLPRRWSRRRHCQTCWLPCKRAWCSRCVG